MGLVEKGLIYECRVFRSEVSGALEVVPDFTETGVYFHPLPHHADARYKENDIVRGIFGKLHDTDKKDKRGVPMFIQYFIPEEMLKNARDRRVVSGCRG